MRKTVIIADDHADTVETLVWFLHVYDFEVIAAYDGRDAVKKVFDICPDFILLDIGLPKFDGFEVATRIRQQRSCQETVIIAYSGHGGHAFYDRAKSVGIDFYILKPADSEILLACFEPQAHLQMVAENIVIWESGAKLQKCVALSTRSCNIVRRAKARLRSRSGKQNFYVN